ncbi:MAG: hypothetical protein WD801_14760 [Gemmatimonadaceae bacterium]
MTRFAFAFATLAISAFGSVAESQHQPPIRPLGPVEATASEKFGANLTVRHVRQGVLVNDVQHRRVVFLDGALRLTHVVADSTPATATAYSGRTGGLIPYHGDSSLFVDPASMSMLLIEPEGKVARVMSVPRSQDAMMLGSAMAGAPGFDGAGRLVYRGAPRFEMRRMATPAGGAAATAFEPPQIPDSTPVVRVDLVSRAVDTLGYVRIPRVKMEMSRDDNGRVTMSATMNPLPTTDDWAVLSDGSVALIRGQDYHIDWIRPDGTRESSPKIPFDWRRLSDEDKAAFIDSVKAARERMEPTAPVAAPVDSGTRQQRRARPDAGGGDGPVRIMIGPGGGAGPGGGNRMNFVTPDELPDYQPVFFANSVRADADGNLWVRTIPTKAREGGAVYDVINSKGELVDRVQVPANRTIVGFGQGGVVYLTTNEGGATTLERATVK